MRADGEEMKIYVIGILCLICICYNKGQTLPEGNPEQGTVCADAVLRMACPTGKDIAVKEVRYGTKLTTTCHLGSNSDACCQYDAGDCFDPPYTGTAEIAACSGYNVCNKDKADRNAVRAGQADSSSCGADYPGLTHYLVMDYYCIPDSRIGVMSLASRQETGNLLYLQNTDYPTGPIRAAETTASCSVETMSCSSQVNVYFVHFELSDGGGLCTDTQNLQVDDKVGFHTYTCSDNTDYTMNLKLTSSSNYLILTLNNPDGVNDGKFKIGFEATENTAPIKLSCPAENQMVCMDCPALVAPANGALSTTDATTGSLVSVSCIAGFSLYGDSTLVCQINGTWTASVGVCRQGCPGLSNPNNGAVLAIGNDVSDTATYTCSTGYVLTGIATRTCQADSTWSGSEPTCTARDNGLPVGAVAGIVICCLFVFAIAAAVILFYCSKRSSKIIAADNPLVSNGSKGVEMLPRDGLARIRENIDGTNTQTPPIDTHIATSNNLHSTEDNHQVYV